MKNLNAVNLGRLGGRIGGFARARSLAPEKRTEIARNAVLARWSRDRLHRVKVARKISLETGADVGILEHALTLSGMSPIDRLAQGLRFGKLSGHLRKEKLQMRQLDRRATENLRTMRVRIRQGSVKVRECVVLAEHEDCVAAEVHCDTKYPILEGVKGEDGRYPFLLAKCDEASLDSDPRYRLRFPTKITFTELPVSKWYMFAVCEGGRYTIEVVFLRRPWPR